MPPVWVVTGATMTHAEYWFPMLFETTTAGRVFAIVAYILCLSGLVDLSALAFALSYGLGFAWLFVMPCGEDDSTSASRAWLALLLVTQALHAFPVAGSQLSWGTFLWIPLAALAADDRKEPLDVLLLLLR